MDDECIQELPSIEISKSIMKGFEKQETMRIFVSGETSEQALNNFYKVYEVVNDE